MSYNVFWHPLSLYPGHPFNCCSRLSWLWHIYYGDTHLWTEKLHRRYGPVVRIAPNELSYIEPQAWYDIYSMKPGRISMSKELEGHVPMDEEGIFTVQDDIEHARIRKSVAAGFSNKSLADQEPRLNRHFDLIIEMLYKQQGEVDISHWMTLFSSDVISDLMFGQSFNSLRCSNHHTMLGLFLLIGEKVNASTGRRI